MTDLVVCAPEPMWRYMLLVTIWTVALAVVIVAIITQGPRFVRQCRGLFAADEPPPLPPTLSREYELRERRRLSALVEFRRPTDTEAR